MVTLLPRAVEHEHRQPHVAVPVLLVQAELVVRVPDLAAGDDVVLAQARHLVLHVPAEAAALQPLPQRHAAAHVAEGADVGGLLRAGEAEAVVVEVAVLVHPDGGHPLVVVLGDLEVGPPLVRGEGAEDVAHPAAGHDLQRPAAHPHLTSDVQLHFTVSWRRLY